MKEIVKLIRYTSKFKKYYIVIAALGVVVALLGQVMPFLLAEIIDKTVSKINGQDTSFSSLAMLIGVIFAARVAGDIFNNILGYNGDILAEKLHKFLASSYYEKLMLLPQSYFDNQHTGTIIGQLDRSINAIANFSNQVSNLFFANMVQAIFSLLIIAYFSWQAAILLLFMFPIYMFFTNRSSDKWQKWEKLKLQSKDKANGRFAEVVAQLNVTKSFNQEQVEQRYFNDQYSSIINNNKKQSLQWQKYDFLRNFSQKIIFSLVLLIIVWFAFNGDISPGRVVLLFTLSQNAVGPLQFISFFIDNLQKTTAASKDYFEVIALDDDEMNSLTEELTLSHANIIFDDVVFSYTGSEEKTLDGVSLSVNEGQTLALVGESGVGKTTIVQLLQRLYPLKAGKITIDDEDIAIYNPGSVRKHIATVFQDPLLFSGSIHDNIAYSRPNATKKEVIDAAKKANAHDFIAKFKDGYNSEIGERGIKLSGGQKQRISIARALLKNAPILILDEATSSLDSKSEIVVQEALERLMKDRTTIVIAHRLSTISNADKIATIVSGKVDEFGTPSTLAKSGGLYNELLDIQNGDTKAIKKKLKNFEIIS